jgi:hypothetical protein
MKILDNLLKLLMFYPIAFGYFIYSQENFYELTGFENSAYYYNSINTKEGLFFGTSNGLVKLLDNEFQIVNEEIKGYINLDQGKLKSSNITVTNNNYRHLLPPNYQNTNTSFSIYDEKLFVIAKGTVFIFKITPYLLLDQYASVRSISKNYVGGYSGIFNRSTGEKIDKPTYTNSYIKEFESATFFCWEGLSGINSNGKYFEFNSYNGKGVLFSGDELGYAVDIAEIQHPNYLLSTSKGIYEINIASKNFNQIKLNHEIGYKFAYRFIREENIEDVKSIYLFNPREIIEYIPSSNEWTVLHNTEDKIIDIYSNSRTQYYILRENSIDIINTSNPRLNKSIEVNQEQAHGIDKLNEFLITTSNFGLNVYNLSNKEYLASIINHELNHTALRIEGNTILAGGVNGLYEIDYNNLQSVFQERITKTIKSESTNRNELLLALLIGTVLTMLTFIIYLLIGKNNNSESAGTEMVSKSELTQMIQTNLPTATVDSIANKLNLTVKEIYELAEPEKPGEIIRRERLSKLTELMRKGSTEEEISAQTGFSISYVKKIKHRSK